MAKIMGFLAPEQLHSVGVNGPSSGECEECGLYRKCKSPRMSYEGQGRKSILIIGSAPSEKVDQSGIPMSGTSGELLRKKLKIKDIDLDRDCWRMDAVACYPGKKADGKAEKVTRKHVKSCRLRVLKAISDLKPRHIWLLGDEAITSYFMERESNCTVNRWRALCIPDPERKAWIVPMYHPLEAIEREKDDHFMSTYDRDLTFAIKCSRYNDPPELPVLNKCVTLLKTYEEVVRELEKVIALCPPHIAIDYETTGLKPYRKGHKIACASFCYDSNKAFAFPYEYRKHFTVEQINHIGDLWIEILSNPKIKVTAHNIKFEDMWTREMMGIDIANRYWCTMMSSHITDNRTEFTGLKFQALIRWGVPDYDADIEKYLKPPNKQTPFNRVMEAPLNDLLLYCGIDSLLTFRLREEHEEELSAKPKMLAAMRFFMEGLITLCDIQENGINMNLAYYNDQKEGITKRLAEMEAALYKFPEAVKFERIKQRPINFGSDHDLRELFFNILGLPKAKLTGSGAGSVDAAVLAELDTPIAKEITKISKLEKICGTYIGQFLREIDDDGRMRPFFDLHVPQTYRGSSSGPNFQNVPIRDEEAKMITRSGIIPSILQDWLGRCYIDPYTGLDVPYEGNQLIDWDYGAMEVRIIASITQDPVLIANIDDPHTAWALELFVFDEATWNLIPKKFAKMLRFETKNGFVFPEFYGSYYGSCARGLFAKCMEIECINGITLFEHLRSVGVIKSKASAYQDFENHVKKIEQRFWHKFKVVKQWQEQAWKNYLQKGYIEQMFGFRCSGWLSKNDVVNYPVQGAAFHCLMWSINKINYEMKVSKMYSRMNGQIHDCCLTDMFPGERKQLIDMSTRIATVEIREAMPWIKVPLLIEWEEGKVNASWAHKEVIHV